MSLFKGHTRQSSQFASIAEATEALRSVISELAPQAPVLISEPLARRAQDYLAHADTRTAISPEATVVAFAGGTGAGKSSLFNAVLGKQVARVAATRPTTSIAQSVSSHAMPDLLDYLEVHDRTEDPELGRVFGLGGTATPLVLIDLPDIDSTQSRNREIAHSLIQRVDVLVWVLDPQKYADAVVHEDYLQAMAEACGVTFVVLNQIDRIPVSQGEALLADAQRVVQADGVDVPVLATSALTGEGIAQLRTLIAQKVSERSALAQRLAADMRSLSHDLLVELGGHGDAGSSRGDMVPATGASEGLGSIEGPNRALDTFVESFSAAAGAYDIARAAGGSYEFRARRSTSWPLLRWLRTKVDPLKVLHLASNPKDTRTPRGEVVRSAPTQHEHARANAHKQLGSTGYQAPASMRAAALNAASAAAAALIAELPGEWRHRERESFMMRTEQALAEADSLFLGENVEYQRHPLWWRLINILQWLLVICAVAGLGWLLLLNFADFLQLRLPDPPAWGIFPLPLLVLVGSVIAGFAISGVSRAIISVGRRRTEKRVLARLKTRARREAESAVINPSYDSINTYRGIIAQLQQLQDFKVKP
ncbi:MAG: 50S ribosome-binding GTPase [Actinomycetaceae bacterium]|nr:50S ribosome-binding GTPase [Arcanobacterium sp.]MDD7504451.1 50S ribosome-binding GTPase [Actinomycetaceae bacterium]MDY6143992.1 GTPase [Arcanobacterium sp.]